MIVRIASADAEKIRADAAAAAPREACGLLLGAAGSIEAVLSAKNVARLPETAFEVDLETLFSAYKAARTGGPAICGCYHSHPNGQDAPSAEDARRAVEPGWIWIIVAGDGLNAYRALPGGPLQGAFEPLKLEVN